MAGRGMQMRRSRPVGGALLGLLAAGVLAVWGAWTVHLYRQYQALAYELEAERQRNFAEMISHVEAMRGLMGKSLAAGSTRQNALYMGEVYRRASLAAANFMALPLPEELGAATGKFLNQIGDFAYSVVRHEAAGRTMDEAQRQELARLYQAATDLTATLRDTGQAAVSEGFRFAKAGVGLSDLFTAWRERRAAGGADLTQDQAQKSLIPPGLNQVGPQMDQMPVLVYDGPFSDHLEQRTPAMGGPAITPEEARARALAFLPEGVTADALEVTERNGRVPVFAVRLPPGGGRPAVTVDLAREGGHLVSYINARPAGEPRLTLEDAREAGLAYLAAHGWSEMEPTYGEVADGFATVQFVHAPGGVRIYPDQVKVRVALDNGEVVGVDARSYVMSHRERGGLTPSVTREQARAAVNPELQVEEARLALIPTEAGDGEVLCWEFRGTLGEETYLVYVNAHTGLEERILQMLITDSGTLAL
ncbi:MAG: germination protein YpeB [Symbiobacterium thermophilum]|uniref:Germination protein YpeB n=3 Tax=Symbiobacterium thermophilum TaxID=2734 RepID=A0A953LJD0_SYMTR|nr:germination protein YpeB [Symbiobacterium thermophilum]